MTSAGKRKNTRKRKRIDVGGPKRPNQARSQTRSARAALLGASNHATRKSAVNGAVRHLDVTELMNRRARAYFELPARFARCRSPFDVWRVQAQFVREGLTDYGRSLNLSDA